jgi:hypothetical protein
MNTVMAIKLKSLLYSLRANMAQNGIIKISLTCRKIEVPVKHFTVADVYACGGEFVTFRTSDALTARIFTRRGEPGSNVRNTLNFY